MTNRKGFTLIELLVVISIIALLIGILLPALGAARRTARQIQNSTQLRGIHQGLVIFAQSNKSGSGEGYYAGLKADGTLAVANAKSATAYGAAANDSTSNSFAILLTANAFTPEYIINPADTGKTPIKINDNVGTANHSYAAIFYNGTAPGAAQGGTITAAALKAEWRETINTSAIIAADRNKALDNSLTGTDSTVWSSNGYKGTMTRNDGSTNFESAEAFAAGSLKYGAAAPTDAQVNVVSNLMRYN